MRRAGVLASALFVLCTACGGDEGSDGDAAEACTSLALADRAITDGDTQRAGTFVDEAVISASRSDDEQMRDAAAALDTATFGSTGDFALALTDMVERCNDLGLYAGTEHGP